ncbi:MAG: cell division protein FtsZ [Candidatus Spechtbacteria bacterium SB0662_bin_43]|uniref:Cell division protein FtsZ n=1 Tax=Candidatus Spechtbacteria bacterium SB0662_bin_43 TaxID=2604897 RepID=A0A845DA96_9BACT|nr:cell division protein FtsZ [Candidatus Spechtbacteria bacterium SB0662_bin_43]
MAQVKPDLETFAKIKVVGVGGSGNNAITRMMENSIEGVDFIAINTDAQDLHFSNASSKIHIGKNLTRGLGAGMDPDIGRRAAEESRDDIQEAVKGADMIFVAYGLGGGTGTGAGPIIAELARESGALTVAVVTRPFGFEGAQRMRIAEEGLNNLQDHVDTLITINNERLLQIIERNTSLPEAFRIVDDVLRQGVQGISDLIMKPGIMNLDFADVRAIMSNAGSALMGIGEASGEERAIDAAKVAINSPLLDLSIDGARGVLISLAGGEDVTMTEIEESARLITDSINRDAKVIFGTAVDNHIKKGAVRITVIATGFSDLPSMISEEDMEKAVMQQGKQSVQSSPIASVPVSSSPVDASAPVARVRQTPSPLVASREAPVQSSPEPVAKQEKKDSETTDWDIPAFIRRKKM